MGDCPSDAKLRSYAQNRLTPDERVAIGAHARECSRCHARMAGIADEASDAASVTIALNGQVPVAPRPPAAPRPTEEPALERGTTIGRYTILSLVGRGGMGEVYGAYDPELDRKIALKLIGARSAENSRSQARLLREAKSIAKLSHANVVVVHDAGTFFERVFVAMEFVDGLTVKEWLAEERRSRGEILAVFGAAARGLAAAHAAGLVHRDFKPHNVMVGKDGSVRVMDFGLAREIDTTTDDEAPMPTDGVSAAELEGGLTRTGELVGTPIYMAPEQFLSQPTDARTDQFSFCVSLYQALYGVLPFPRTSLQELVAEVLAGRVQPPPVKHDVPTWLRRVLLRGLAVDPAARWPSMAALIAALEHDPARRRRRWLTIAGVALLATIAGATVVRSVGRAQTLCLGGPARLSGIWEPPGTAARPRRDALAAAFAAAAPDRGAETWGRVEPLLDRYAASWLAMYRDTCEATHARGEQSPQTLDVRMSCLEGRRTALAALTNIFASPDQAVVENAVDAANRLPEMNRCADLKLLRAPIEPPRDEATRAQIEALRKRAAEVKAMGDTGRFREAAALAHAITVEARTLDYRPFLAEALIREGELQERSQDIAGAARSLEEGAWAALGAHADDLAFEAAAVLTSVVGYQLARHEEGWRWSRLAHATLDRLGPGHEVVLAWLLVDEGNLKQQEHDLPSAIELFRKALAIKEKALPADHPDIALSLLNLTNSLSASGRHEEALRTIERALGIVERAYGRRTFDYARALESKGEVLLALGRTGEAERAVRDALAYWEADLGRHHATAGFPLTALGVTLVALGRPGEAIEPLRRALALREKSEVDPSELATTRFALARALRAARRDAPEARALAVGARAGFAARKDDDARRRVSEIDAWLAAPP